MLLYRVILSNDPYITLGQGIVQPTLLNIRMRLDMQSERKKKKRQPYAYKRAPGLVGNESLGLHHRDVRIIH